MNTYINNALLLLDEALNEAENGFVACNRCGDQENTKDLDFIDKIKSVRDELIKHSKTDLRKVDDERSVSKHNTVLSTAFSLYTAPFKFHRGYIFDSDGNTVADQDGYDMVKNIVRIRGWGRIQYMDNAEALQDKIGELTALALTEYWNKHKGL